MLTFYRYLKNVINIRKRVSPNMALEEQAKYLDDKDIQTKDTKQNIFVRQNDFTEAKEKKQKIKMPTIDTNEVKNRIVPNNKINVRIQTEKSDHIIKDTIKTEKIDKADSEVLPNECSFITWWKNSFTSLKQKPSKDILKSKYQLLQRKVSDCKKSLTRANEKQSEDKLKCNYQYLQDKMNKCKTPFTSTKETQIKNGGGCKQCSKDKMGDCKRSFTNLTQKQSKNEEKCSYRFLHNKITQCTEKVRATKTKKGLISYGVNYCKFPYYQLPPSIKI